MPLTLEQLDEEAIPPHHRAIHESARRCPLAICGFDKRQSDRHCSYMKSSDIWARRMKGRLERAGFKVSVLDPVLALERKRASRRREMRLMTRGKASQDQLQRANSLFGGNAKRFQIVDYGGLDE